MNTLFRYPLRERCSWLPILTDVITPSIFFWLKEFNEVHHRVQEKIFEDTLRIKVHNNMTSCKWFPSTELSKVQTPLLPGCQCPQHTKSHRTSCVNFPIAILSLHLASLSTPTNLNLVTMPLKAIFVWKFRQNCWVINLFLVTFSCKGSSGYTLVT